MNILFVAISCTVLQTMGQTDKKTWKDAESQVNLLYKEAMTSRVKQQVFPRTVNNDSVKLVVSNDWTSGFWPGILWFMYEYTGKQEWKTRAGEFTALMEREPKNRNSHDVGFKVYNSYGNGWRLAGDEAYKKQVIQGAVTLSTRFSPVTGCIKSWDFPQWQYPVIVDNMMNLELLFAATRLTHDSSFYKIAVSHANTTLKNHFRPDHSSYHVVDYDTLTGKVIGKTTHQGYAKESAWARGQAWGLYGYTMCYRETKDPAYLKQAELIAAFILNNPNLPADMIPYWDFNAPDPAKEPRDASAAAIIASALYELKNYSALGKQYRKTADRIMKSLVGQYRSAPGGSKGFILLHSTGNKPAKGEVDVPLIYADYYFLEALLRRQKK
ncbi:MAG TPA: glycoside hydrolase family 88 protein [Chitinophagaceae bacterium]|nr:glycoside hydrolase family 88 protein [Chitinophagaceae bacterium]